MNQRLAQTRVVMLSSVHRALDSRIYYREARSLHRAGYDVKILAIHPRDEVIDGIEIKHLPEVIRWKRPWLWLLLLHRALAARADIFHFHDPELLLIVPWIRLLTGKPTIYDVHETYSDFIAIKSYLPLWFRRLLSWAFSWIEPLLARLHCGLVFADDHIARAFEGVQLPKATLFNYPTSEFLDSAFSSDRMVEGESPVIVHVGTHERSRGIFTMIEAFSQVLTDVSDARLLLVGPFEPPDLRQRVGRDLHRRGISDAVTITGRVPFDEVGQYLRRASLGWIVLQPVRKYQKNIPTKLFEYMAYGLPVVTSDLPPIEPFVRDSENGYKVSANDPTAHARAIVRILSDHETARRMGNRNREAVRSRYNWKAVEEDLLTLYDAILS